MLIRHLDTPEVCPEVVRKESLSFGDPQRPPAEKCPWDKNRHPLASLRISLT